MKTPAPLAKSTPWSIGAATVADTDAIRRLLSAAGLPADDFAAHLRHFLVARAAGQIVGAVGLEIYEGNALLRSLVVSAEYRGHGLGRALVAAAVSLGAREAVDRLFLLTTTAAPFFERLGFKPFERAKAPVAIADTTEFRELCPSSSACLAANLGEIRA